ncbi:MAG: hypothetical protein HUU32_01965 [Calditrichaceae bacterium]|nr:hypothetical protein [Calditrichia bacterium]NUQ40141.1 hypothetical protein [Calditrichaceae bacterium]
MEEMQRIDRKKIIRRKQMMQYPEFETGVAESMAANPAIYVAGWEALTCPSREKTRKTASLPAQEPCRREGIDPFKGMMIALLLAVPFWVGVGILLLK